MPLEISKPGAYTSNDALIAEAAVRSRYEVLYSEVFGHGRGMAGLRVRNPFLQSPGT